jgi:hypothetical protein
MPAVYPGMRACPMPAVTGADARTAARPDCQTTAPDADVSSRNPAYTPRGGPCEKSHSPTSHALATAYEHAPNTARHGPCPFR